MSKTKEFKVSEQRLLFKCPSCGARRTSVIPDIRRKTVRCPQCGEMVKCLFNRRPEQRVQHSGKLMLTTRDSRKIEVTLLDISSRGIGLELPASKALKLLSVGTEFTLTCSWNSKLLPDSRYVVRNIQNLRVGAERIRR